MIGTAQIEEQDRRRETRALAAALLLALALILDGMGSARAHFLLNINVRVIHVEHLEDGLRVYLRLPMPYLVADRVGPAGAHGLPEAAPYTTNRMEDGKPAHYIDPAALRRDPEGLGRFAADGFRFAAAGEPLAATVERVRAHPVGTQPPFATLSDEFGIQSHLRATPSWN